jgi:hypothetical protein
MKRMTHSWFIGDVSFLEKNLLPATLDRPEELADMLLVAREVMIRLRLYYDRNRRT